MSRFVKILIIIALVMAALLLITYLTPGIKALAKGLATATDLPIWLVGLAAPILFVFKRLGGMLGRLADSPTEKAIREKNEAISARLNGIERDVQQLNDWRTREIATRTAVIQERDRQIAPLEERARNLDVSIAALQRERDQLPRIQDDPGLIE